MTKGSPVVGLLAVLGAAALSWPASAGAQALRVQYRTGSTAATGNQIAPTLNVVNTGSAAVALSTLTVRYWYTVDGARTQSFFCDYTPRGCSNVTGRFVTLGSATGTADTYLEVGFTSGAGSLAAGQSTGELQLRFAKSDWSSYTQTNDWSFDGTRTALADWSRVTLYQGGALVWGTEPGGGAPGDTTPPTAPTQLTSPSRTTTSVSLTWTASTDDVGVTGYDVYRGTTLAGSSTTTSYTATGLTASTAYGFTVRAKDAAGNVSPASAALSVTTSAGTTADTTPPTAPTNLTAPSKTSTAVSLSWTASTDNLGVTGYDVYVGTTLAGSSTTTNYTATGLTASTAYAFTVRAKDAAGNVSPASAALSVTTSASSTGAPAISVGSTSLGFGTVTLNSSRSQTFAVSNTGTAPLEVTMSRASGTSGEFTFSPPSFSLVPGGRKLSVVTYAPTAVGTDSGALVLSTNDSARRTVSLSLSGTCASSAYPGCTPTSAGHTTDTNCASCHASNPCTSGGGQYPGCKPTSTGHTTSTNCTSCHSSNPCTSGGLYPGCTAPSTSRHRNRTDCTTCHSANPCTSFPFPGCRMPSSHHSGTNANCRQCHRSNPCNDD